MTITLLISIASAIAALLAVGASMYSARNTKEIATEQVKASFKLMSEQIQAQKELAIAQISASKELSREEITFQVLSKNRQEWINDLRNTISHFISSTHKCRNNLAIPPEQRDLLKINNDVDSAWFHLSRLRLLVNPKEDDHKELVITANAFLDSIFVKELQGKEKDIEVSLIKQAQTILKREWERVKSLA